MSLAAGLLVDEAEAEAGRVSLLRSVSGRPGAEGALFDACACCRVVMLVVELGLAAGGAMRRDWVWLVSHLVTLILIAECILKLGLS